LEGNGQLVTAAALGRGHVLLRRRHVLLRRGRLLEGITLAWNVVGIAVLAGLALNAAAGLWWADPLAALVIVFYALREAREIFLPGPFALRSTAKPGAL
jgi:hypothetical protein